MSINQTDVIDAIGIDKRTGKLILTIMDHLEWQDDSSEHFLLLQEKLNTYLRFVESEEVLQSYPEAKGKSIVIDVVGKYALTHSAKEFFARLVTIIQGAGMQLRFRQLLQ